MCRQYHVHRQGLHKQSNMSVEIAYDQAPVIVTGSHQNYLDKIQAVAMAINFLRSGHKVVQLVINYWSCKDEAQKEEVDGIISLFSELALTSDGEQFVVQVESYGLTVTRKLL